MNEQNGHEDNKHEEGEEMLGLLIKQAGNQARERKAKALAIHQSKLEAAVKEALSKRKLSHEK